MGSFVGHLTPGLFFFLFGIRWTYAVFVRHFRFHSHLDRRRRSVQVRNVDANDREERICLPTYPCGHRDVLPVEGLILLLCCVTGFLGELFTAFENGVFIYMGNSQHMVMFAFFAIFGLVEVLAFYEVAPSESGPAFNVDTSYASMAMAVFIEGLLFYFHLHGRTPLDVHVHQLLLVAIVSSFFAVLVEWRLGSDSMLSGVFRLLCVLVQGSWFIQIGFILYNPFPGAVPWAAHDHDQIMLVTTLFCAHVSANLFLIVIIAALLRWRYNPQTSMHFEKVPLFKEIDQELNLVNA